MINKMTEHHLSRSAYVYVRQSTLQQVKNNLESPTDTIWFSQSC